MTASEITFREQAELLDLTHDAIFVRDLTARIVYWNRGAELLYGWKREEALGLISHELLKTDFPVPLAEIEAATVTSGAWEGELIHRRRDGSIVIVSTRWALRRDEGGEASAILEVNRDITTRKQEEQKFRGLLESAPDSIVIVDANGIIQLVNAQTEKLFGYSRDELVNQAIEILIPERFQPSHCGHRDNFARAPHARSMGVGLELYGRRKDGTEFPVEVSLAPLAAPSGLLVSSAIRDITNRRHVEQHIQRLNLELNQKVAELTTANRELESFSYSVSHDLRAPLRHIDGFARILKEEFSSGIPEEGQRYLSRIVDGATHMGHLVDDMLNLAKIGRRELLRTTSSLDDLVREVVAELCEQGPTRPIEWKVGSLPDASCDSGLMKIVFTNLLANAVKFTRMRGRALIEIGVQESRGATVFFVKDNGVGFDMKYADKLFGVFQRLHREEDFEGTGVGLAIVQRIIHRHGGEIWVDSKLDQGATFYFTLSAAAGSARKMTSQYATQGLGAS